MPIKGKKNLRFRCNGCGRCCHLWIPVTDSDVRRIMSATGMAPTEIVRFLPRRLVKDNAKDLVWIDFGAGKKDRRAMVVREKGKRCTFLVRRRCIIYESRPMTCREHPFLLTPSKDGRKIKRVEIQDPCDCAGTLDGKNRRRDLLKLDRRSDREESAYVERVRRWNRRETPGTHREFLEYVGLLAPVKTA